MKHFFMLLLFAISFLACNQNNSNKSYDALPELPENILSQLDTTRMATRHSDVIVLPVRDTMSAVAAAPCCGIKIERSLKVTMPYVKCGPLLDFIMTDIDEMMVAKRRTTPGSTGNDTTGNGSATLYKFTKTRSSGIQGPWVCMTSQGPWDAVLTENRSCANYSPHYSLIVTPYGDVVVKQWTGGIGNHPSDIGLVSCRYFSTLETPCGALSNCDCRSAICKAPDPCNCGIEGEW